MMIKFKTKADKDDVVSCLCLIFLRERSNHGPMQDVSLPLAAPDPD